MEDIRRKRRMKENFVMLTCGVILFGIAGNAFIDAYFSETGTELENCVVQNGIMINEMCEVDRTEERKEKLVVASFLLFICILIIMPLIFYFWEKE